MFLAQRCVGRDLRETGAQTTLTVDLAREQISAELRSRYPAHAAHAVHCGVSMACGANRVRFRASKLWWFVIGSSAAPWRGCLLMSLAAGRQWPPCSMAVVLPASLPLTRQLLNLEAQCCCLGNTNECPSRDTSSHSGWQLRLEIHQQYDPLSCARVLVPLARRNLNEAIIIIRLLGLVAP